jgi:hypothetical protein
VPHPPAWVLDCRIRGMILQLAAAARVQDRSVMAACGGAPAPANICRMSFQLARKELLPLALQHARLDAEHGAPKRWISERHAGPKTVAAVLRASSLA